jgi:hypothetical protein
MPQIIVTAGSAREAGEGAVTLRERVSAADFESERFGVNLLERIGWAVSDASELEQHNPLAQDDREEHAEPEPEPDEYRQPDFFPEPLGVA